jgi:hypothetical protein
MLPASMRVPVVLVRHLRMGVPYCLVPVPVAVRSCRNRTVAVRVMHVVVARRVFVLKRLVLMLVRVALQQMEHDRAHHQRRAGEHPRAAAAIAEREGDRCTDEGG